MSNHDFPCPKCGIDMRIHYHHDESTCTGPEPEPVKVQSRAHYRYSTRDAMTKLEQARKLLAEATPRPWHSDRTGRLFGDAGGGEYEHIIRRERIHCGSDAALIVAAVNDYAALLDVVEAADFMLSGGRGAQEECAEVVWVYDHVAADALCAAIAKWEES